MHKTKHNPKIVPHGYSQTAFGKASKKIQGGNNSVPISDARIIGEYVRLLFVTALVNLLIAETKYLTKATYKSLVSLTV